MKKTLFKNWTIVLMLFTSILCGQRGLRTNIDFFLIERYDNTLDSIFRREKQDSLVVSDNKFETEWKNKDIGPHQLKAEKSKNSQNIIVFTGLFLFLVVVVIYQGIYIMKISGKKQDELQLQKGKECQETSPEIIEKISQDIGNSMTLIINYLRIIKEKTAVDKELQKYISAVILNSKKIDSNTYDLVVRIHNLLEKFSLIKKNMAENIEKEEEKNETFKEIFLNRIETVVSENFSNENFKIQNLGNEMGYSQRQLARKIKKYTGHTPVNYILEIKLQKAYELIKNRKFSTLCELRFSIGITSSSYFNKAFKKRFGMTPSELLDSL